MFFNSAAFGVFFGVVLVLYWLLHKNGNARNAVLLVASMFFYSRLHYSFPIYLLAMISVSYLLGRVIAKQEDEKRRKRWLVLGVCILSAGLVYTKYSGFVLGGIHGLQQWQASALHILVPVGISFYTFAVIGYILEVYYEGIAAERNYLTYAAYVSFFPQLLSGPIPSAPTILPQFSVKPKLTVNGAMEGVGEFLWGLFKKMVVADNISMAVSYAFSANNEDLGGSSLFIGAALFGVSIYADFSGYSSMARGCAKLLGIDLVHNFNLPLFSRSVSEYWRRWHISLTTFLNTYIYTPLVYSMKSWGRKGVIVGIFVTFLISGIWHGAGWQYIIFGVVNGLAIIYEILTKDIRQRIFGRLPRWLNGILSNLFVVVFMLFSWIFFRANSVGAAMNIISRICSRSFFSIPDSFVLQYLKWCVPLLVIEWVQRNGKYTLDLQQWLPVKVIAKGKGENTKIFKVHILLTTVLYIFLTLAIYFFCKKVNMAEYYYFKF